MGSVVVKKVQAEPEKPGQPLRWIANGKTILNNKGKPVKQYEPYFSASGHRYEEPKEEGVTPVIYYDAAGRTVRTEMPDGSYNRVEFSPWHVLTYDQNDTVLEPKNAWFTRKSAGTAEEKRAAQLAAEHADTPALTILDSLGREVIAIAHNRVKDSAGVLQDEKYLTFTKLDAEGKPLWIRDARKNLVMQYINPPKANNDPSDTLPITSAPCYDIAGNLLFQHSMDASDRWMINDAAGKPMVAWDSRGHIFRTEYDTLHRPIGSFVKGADANDPAHEIQFEKIIYGDTPGNGLADAKKLNLRGMPYQHYDTAGVMISEAHDFKGNSLRSTRQLIKDYKATLDWSQNPILETEIFASSTRYDALNRPIQLIAPHSNQSSTKFNVIRPSYNEANLLERVDVWLEQTAEPAVLLNPTTANLKAVTNIDYDAKGQRVRIEYNEAGHPIITEYSYDKETFRLTRLLTTRPKHPESDKRTLQDLSYTYDPVGNITEIRDAAQQTVFFNNTRIEPSNAYTYDALYRLIFAEGREHAVQNNMQRDAKNFESDIGIPFPNSPEALQRYSEDYEYDPVGNILGFHHTGGGTKRWGRWYQYALDSNRLIATRSPGENAKLPFYAATPGYNAKYTYDAHGNMTAMPHLPTMELDFKDQLHASQQQVVNDGTGEKTYYVYDGGGQRVRKITETQTGNLKDERIYLGGFEVYRKYNGNGQTLILERETLHVMDDKQRIALVETRTLDTAGNDPSPRQLIRYQLGNHLGSAVLELDDQAQIISYEEYHPYGTTAYCAGRSAAEVSLKRYRYTGKERDEETGFSYHGARYYAGWLGRWVNADPVGLIDGPNLYRYARNAPTAYTDGSGQDPDPVNDEKTKKDDEALKAIGVTRQQVIDYADMHWSQFIEKYGGSGFVDRLRFRLSFPKDKVEALPSGLLNRVLPKKNYDMTVYMFASGRTGTLDSEKISRAKEIQVPTGTGAVLATGGFVLTGEYDPALQRVGDNVEGVASGLAFARQNRASNSAGAVVVDKPGGIVGTTGRDPMTPSEPTTAPPTGEPLIPPKPPSGGSSSQPSGGGRLFPGLSDAEVESHIDSSVGGELKSYRVKDIKSNSQYDRLEIETKSGINVKSSEAVDQWNKFLGGYQVATKGESDRIWTGSGDKSIRFGHHEMNSPKLHYHQETWFSFHIENILQRVQTK